MRKSSIFISAALTTFALVILYGVVSAYHGAANTVTATPQATETSIPEATSTPEQTALTPEEAGQLAAQVLGKNDLLSAESSSVNGTNAYMITFLSGDIVYVGLDGQILSIQIKPKVITVQVQPTKPANKNNHNGGNNSTTATNNNGGGEHESGD